MSEQYLEQPPPPSTLLFAIRSIGYNFETAVADIIDNSISAQASEVRIFSEPSGIPYFCFLDNGTGMTESELKNAMLLGSNRSQKIDSSEDLGRFGLGLKSASLSQCRKFSVISKRDNCINAITFDIDIIEQTQKWNVVRLSKTEYKDLPEISRLFSQESGTLVIWQNFDKLAKNTKNFDVSFRKQVALAQEHVEFVFHRFYNEIKIFFNERRIEKRDPFLVDSYGRQQQGRMQKIKIERSEINITPYTLPYANTLSREEKNLLGNPKSIYDEQGLYLYRNRRLIAWGSWFYTEVRSELNKLARVQVDIPSSLDDIWMLDVKKSSAKIPDKIKETIRTAINESTLRSRGTVRHPGERERGAEQKVWDRFEAPDRSSVKYLLNRKNPLLQTLQQRLETTELNLLEQFIKQVESFIPKHTIHIDQTDDIQIADPWAPQNENDLLEDLLQKVRIAEEARDRLDLLDRYLCFETYAKLKNIKEQIQEMLKND